MSITLLISLLPITIMGIGTREAALIFMLTPFGIGTPEILIFSINIFLVCHIGSVLIGAVSWCCRPAVNLKSK